MPFTRLLLCLALLALPVSAWSAEFCISSGDTASLANALVTSQTNGEDDFIYLEPGLYSLSAANPKLIYYTSTFENLTIEGGYTPFFGGGCGKLIQYGADATVIDGTAGRHDMYDVLLASPGGGRITLKFLEIQNMVNTDPSFGSAIILGGVNGGNADVDLENVIFQGNGSVTYSPIVIGSNQTIVRNSVFAKNEVFASYAQIHIDAKASGTCVAIFNSTVTGNVGGSYALSVKSGTPGCIPVIANSIFWGSSSGDLYISIPNQSSALFLNNDIENYDTAAGSVIGGLDTLVSVDPLFVDPSSGDYSLREMSLLHDRGNDLAFFGGPGPLDVLALPRTDGTSPDMGAYEMQDVIFANGVDQSLQ